VKQLFLLSPASTSGIRAGYLFKPRSSFAAAMSLREPGGAPLSQVFSFLSGLYFRGKVAYSRAFARPPKGLQPAYVITPSRGLVDLEAKVTLETLREFAQVPIDEKVAAYRAPLVREAEHIAARLPPKTQVVLLGSVASRKYVNILADVFGARLVFPIDFVGRGDMSRGGLLLRHAADGVELPYAPVLGAVRKGKRPARLVPRPGLQRQLTGKPPVR
jgi:hypothetical protein